MIGSKILLVDDEVVFTKNMHRLLDARGYRTVAVNSGGESPNALEMAAGSLAGDELLGRLDTGLYLNNLWYCNFSDRNDCRITGMTRFACFWVEQGVIQAPLNVMRFDDSVYRMLGDALVGLTRERELIPVPVMTPFWSRVRVDCRIVVRPIHHPGAWILPM